MILKIGNKLKVIVAALLILSGKLYSQEPDFWLKLAIIDIERAEVKMVRGETFLPKEKYAYITDEKNNQKIGIYGKYYESVTGVNANALLLDGFTSHPEIPGDKAPIVFGSYSLDALIAIGAHPTHICLKIDNKHNVNIGYHNGYSFSLDALGRLSFKFATNGKTEELVARETIPLNTWTYIAAVYNEKEEIKIFINGIESASKAFNKVVSRKSA